MPASDAVQALKLQLGSVLACELAGWRAADVAVRIGVEPARISDLRRGRLRRFSLDRLIQIASKLRLELRLIAERGERRKSG